METPSSPPMQAAQEQASSPALCIETRRHNNCSECSWRPYSPLVITPEPSATIGRSGIARGQSSGSDIAGSDIVAGSISCEPEASPLSSLTQIERFTMHGGTLQDVSLAYLTGRSHASAFGTGKVASCGAQSDAVANQQLCSSAGSCPGSPPQQHGKPLGQQLAAIATTIPNLARDCTDSDEFEGNGSTLLNVASYPPCLTPCNKSGPAYFNPLFDGGSEFPSPVTQPPSATTEGPASTSRCSQSQSPTRHIGVVPTVRRGHTRWRRNVPADGRRDLRSQASAAAVLAALPLLYDLGPTTCFPSGQSLAALVGVGDGVTASGDGGRWQACHMLGCSVDPDDFAAVARDESEEEDFVGIGAERLGATLDLMRRATALQRQLVSRIKEAAALRLRLEESDAAREEMGLQMLECQEYIISLERRLEHEARSRSALVAQSQLLQEQLQETGEALHDALAELQACQLRLAQYDGTQAPLEQVPGRVQGSSSSASITTCTSTGISACNSSSIATTSTTVLISGASSSGELTARSSMVSESGFASEGAITSDDPRDLELNALRRENHALTQRLIKLSLDLAQSREKEEEARHEVQLLHDLNQGAMESVNSLSLELSLLRPNACGRARGRFSLPFLWSGNSSNTKNPVNTGL